MEIDRGLLEDFLREIKSKVPHIQDTREGRVVVNPTPLVDVTNLLVECANSEYGLDIPAKEARVFGKLDSHIFGGSVKVRPMVSIVEEAITSGKLHRGQTVFEATSGNFGLALGLAGKLGLDVVVLVSRKLQEGVLNELKKDGVKIVNLDIDICPAPGVKIDTNALVANAVASNLRDQLGQLGLDISLFDSSRIEVEELLSKQDAINLAKLLAKIYDGFCPEQYNNELNVKTHLTVTGPEIDLQLAQLGLSLADFELICAFGTGGTSTGIARYLKQTYGIKSVRVVFPLADQDVAGIRTKEKALGLKFYEPELYKGQHEVDFEAARRVLRFFASRGFDIGESSALALYACMQMLNYGAGERYVVILADGISKYMKSVETRAEATNSFEVTLQDAASHPMEYEVVLWTHGMFKPKEEGVKLITSSLGCDRNKLRVAKASDVQRLLTSRDITEDFSRLLPQDSGRVLLVCMVGATSLQVAKLLKEKGIRAQSLNGGVVNLSASGGRQPLDLVEIDRE